MCNPHLNTLNRFCCMKIKMWLQQEFLAQLVHTFLRNGRETSNILTLFSQLRKLQSVEWEDNLYSHLVAYFKIPPLCFPVSMEKKLSKQSRKPYSGTRISLECSENEAVTFFSKRGECAVVNVNNSPSTLRFEKQEVLPPVLSAIQVQRPPSSTMTGATSTQKKLPSCTKWNRSPSSTRSLFRSHETCSHSQILLTTAVASNNDFKYYFYHGVIR